MTKQLPLINPPLAYQGSGDGFEGYRRGFDWGKNRQRDADQSVVDGLDKKIKELAAEIERLKGMMLTKGQYVYMKKHLFDSPISNVIKAKLKAQSEQPACPKPPVEETK
jgi:uncharacterized small protein (DUF1192 family)